MDKLKIWLIPGLVVLLALAGLVYFRGRLPEQPTEKPAVVEEEEEVGETEKPKGFAKPPEPSAEEKVESDKSAVAKALDSGDLSDCEEITWDEELKNQCEDNLNYSAVLKSGDESQCEILHNEDLKTECYNKIYMTVAVDQKDPSICNKIMDAELKQMCLDQVQMLISRYAKSADECSSIASATLRQQCEDNFYMHSSAEELNIEGCDNISDSNLSDQCKKTVTKNIEVIEQSKQAALTATETKSLEEILQLCDSLSGNKATTCKDAVYPQLAYDQKDVSYCDKISDELAASECKKEQGEKINSYYLRQAIAANDKTLCDEISDSELKELCLSS